MGKLDNKATIKINSLAMCLYKVTRLECTYTDIWLELNL